jgi:membrane-bound lytic murein transglycosylase MltF
MIVTALAAHGVFDLTYGAYIANAAVLVWWPHFRLTFDLTAAAYLAWLLRTNRIRAAA